MAVHARSHGDDPGLGHPPGGGPLRALTGAATRPHPDARRRHLQRGQQAHPALPSQLDPRFYVCGGRAEGGPAACGGDSGSPLVIHGRLAGVFGPVISRNGMVCRSAYSGYTRIDVYADLIRAELER